MTTQPQFPNPGTQAPARSRRRVADRPTAPNPPSRHPRRTCPEPVEEPALSLSKGDPAATNTPGPPPYPVNPRPPTHRLLASQPAHPTWSEPPPHPPRIGPIPPPRALKSFLEKTLTRAQHPGVLVQNPAVLAHPSSRRLQPGPSGNQQARVSVPPRQSRVPSLTVS